MIYYLANMKNRVIKVLGIAGTMLFLYPTIEGQYKINRLRKLTKFAKPSEEMSDKEIKEILELMHYQKHHFGNRLQESMFALSEMQSEFVRRETSFKQELQDEMARNQTLTNPVDLARSQETIEKLTEKIKYFNDLAYHTNRNKVYTNKEVSALLKKA